MKYYIPVDENNFVMSIGQTGTDLDTVELNLEDYDLDKGKMSAYQLINNVLVLNDKKWAEIKLCNSEAEKQEEISYLEECLTNTDYIWAKINEGVSTREDYADLIAQRQVWRERIRELQGGLM